MSSAVIECNGLFFLNQKTSLRNTNIQAYKGYWEVMYEEKYVLMRAMKRLSEQDLQKEEVFLSGEKLVWLGFQPDPQEDAAILHNNLLLQTGLYTTRFRSNNYKGWFVKENNILVVAGFSCENIFL